MSVYFGVVFFTFLFGLLAQQSDEINGVFIDDNGRVYHSPKAKMFFIIASLILICVAGLRYFVGTDYGAYYYGYSKYAERFWDALKNLDEPGYPLLSKIAQWIYPDGAIAIFLASLVTVGLAMIVMYRNTDQLFLSILLFLFLGCWNGGFNGVRQYLAASVLFCGYPFLKRGNFWKFAFCVFLSFLCHRSAIVMIVPFFLSRRKVNLKNILFLVVATALIYYSADRLFELASFIMDKEYSLDNGYSSHSVNIIRIFVAVTPPLVFIPAWWGKSDSEHDFYQNILIMFACIRIMTMYSALLYRIGIYTTLFEMMAIPKLLDGFAEKNRKLITIAIVVLFCVYWLYEVRGTQFNWIWSR